MRLLRDFLCEHCGTEKERYIDSDTSQVVCDECGNTAVRLIGMPRVALEGITGSFPGAADRWAKIREDRHRKRRDS
jgi:DNA-directed RNA polymerase subunit RPC12/RpoP